MIFWRATAYSMLSVLYAIVRPSVRLSLCLSVTRVDHAKTVEVRIVKFSPYGSPISLVCNHVIKMGLVSPYKIVQWT